MVFANDIPACAIERDNPMWRWVGDARSPLGKDELIKRLNARKQRCSSVVRLFHLFQQKSEWWCKNRLYILPNKLEKLVSDLSELSLTHTIVGVNTPGMGVEVALVESEAHTSNIDYEVLKSIAETKSRRLS